MSKKSAMEGAKTAKVNAMEKKTAKAEEVSSREAQRWVESNWRIAARLPLDGDFLASSIPTINIDKLQDVESKGVVEKVGRFDKDGRSKGVNVYSVTENGRIAIETAYERLDEVPPNTLTLPCACRTRGIQNEEGTQWYRCQACDGRWTKEEVMDANPSLGGVRGD